MTGEIDQVSLKIGELAGTTETLVKQNAALFRQHRELGEKIDSLAQSFAGYSQQTLAASAGADRRIVALEDAGPAMDGRVDSLETFKTQTEEAAKIKTRQTMLLFGAGGVVGGMVAKAIEFFQRSGHT